MNNEFFHIDKTLTPKFQNKINISIVFNHLRENGPISRTKISKDLKLSVPAVSRSIDFLKDNGYIIEYGHKKTSIGKRPMLLKINDEGYVIGVDLGKSKINIAITNFLGNMVYTDIGFETPSNIEVNEKIFTRGLTKLIKKTIKKAVNNKIIKPKNLKAICFAVSAPVSVETKKIVDIPLYGNYRKEFNVPTFMENDVNCSAYCEKKLIKDKKIKDIIFIEISRGIGCGIIIDNKLFKGSHGTSGEIGNSIINTSNLSFKIKNKGFLEKHASVEGIKKLTINNIINGRNSILTNNLKSDINSIETKDIFLAALKDDKLSQEIINNAVDLVSITLLNLILIIDPQIVVIGGDICSLPEAESLFLDPIKSKISTANPFKTPEIRFSIFGKNAGVCGAAQIAIENMILKKFPFKIRD